MGGSSSKVLDGVERGKVIDTFKAKWIGTVPVKSMSGRDVAKQAVERLIEIGMKEVPCFIEVTTKGVYLMQGDTKDVIKEVAINDVSFVAQDVNHPSIVSFFENYQQMHVVLCHSVKLKANIAFHLSIAINTSFKMLHENDDGEGASATDTKDSTLTNKDWTGATAEPMKRRMSYAAAMKEVSKSRAEMRAAVEDNSRTLVVKETCELLGTYEIEDKTKSKDIAHHMTYIQRNSPKRGEPCSVTVTERRLRAMASKEKKGEKALVDIPLTNITKCNQIKTEKYSYFGFMSHDNRLDTITAYLFMTPPQEEGEISLRRHVHDAQIKRSEVMRDRRSSVKKASKADHLETVDKDSEEFQLVGNYEAIYLGKCWVPTARVPTKENLNAKDGLVPAGHIEGEYGEEAVKFVLSYRNEPRQSIVQVSAEGVRRIDAATFESRMFSHTAISCTTIVRDRYLIMYLGKTEKTTLALVFQCIDRRAGDIAMGIKQGFHLSQLRVQKNPFAAVSGRSKAPPTLFRKQVHRGELEPLHELGAGAFGVVYKAQHKDKHGGKQLLAVKCLRQGASDADKDEFVREAEACLEFDHENVASCMGVAVQQRPWLLVFEYVDYGDVQTVLEQAGRSKIKITSGELLLLCHGIVKGMNHISSLRFIHMDLAARNVLLATGNVTKVTDFGLARKLPDGEDFWRATAVLKLPVKWCAPESMLRSIFSTESDVWSAGVTLWEVFSMGEVPYKSTPVREIHRRVKEGLRLTQPDACSLTLWDVIKRCFEAKRKDRPTFKNLASELGLFVRNEMTRPRAAPRDIGMLVKSGSK
mmetsp:Transcript_8586/g.22158  ORF Transcript_8586/g.22158 Transcript_8586/m.22158 type:complete len:811 (+) Transcript_8586:268-2700(+)